MAQAPPTFVSSKNSASASPAHLHRQIELQSNAQTPFLECYLGATPPAAPGVIVFDQVIKDTFGRYNIHTGVYVFPVNGFWVATFWGGSSGVALNFYSVPLNPSDPSATQFPGQYGQSNTFMTTWQFWAGPNTFGTGGTPGVGAMAVFSSGGGIGGPYDCQLDLVCVAQY